MKTRWLIPVTLVVVLAIATVGAFAYFNSARTTTGQITAGNLDLKLGLSETGPWENSVTLPWNFNGMAPGDTISGDIWLLNTGTIDARQLTFDWNSVDNPTFADHIFLIHAWDSKNTTDAISQFVPYADGKIPGSTLDGKVSLSELAYLSTFYGIEASFGYPFDATSDVSPFLPPNSPQYLHLEFQFDPEAGNDLQNAVVNYGLTITAEQKVIFPKLVP